MNPKLTIASVLFIASMYGQVTQASEVTISQLRLASLNGLQMTYLAENDLVRFENGNAILNMPKLEAMLKIRETNGEIDFANTVIKPCVPYGNT